MSGHDGVSGKEREKEKREEKRKS